jgi:ApaG protein
MTEKHKILVQTEACYIAAESQPAAHRYFFAYTITITNAGSEAAQLLSRHWLITDTNGKIQEVRGDGVVGEQPYLKSGEVFRYSSAAMLATAVGTMQGSYTFRADSGELFDVPIERFTLSIPRTLH